MGEIVREIALRSYLVQIGQREVKRHIDDITVNHSPVRNGERDDSWMYSAVDTDIPVRPPRTYPSRNRRPVDLYHMIPYV